ncbi:MAG: hypothetical protein H6667_08120 [Ardenticatenaceae bacterium]|nr:hypothetical protein [Ardenticatenaceae bacterium]MCB9444686.1 hypothetical protein [Ardenticatenaceae bacterium]
MMQQWLSRFPRVNRKNKLYSTGSEIHLDLTSAVTGSIDNGRYLAVWENMAGGFNGDNYNVRGQLTVPKGLSCRRLSNKETAVSGGNGRLSNKLTNYANSTSFPIRTAATFVSGILATGSSAEFVSTFVGASGK